MDRTERSGDETRQRGRRSHAERRAETRSRIIGAVVECIADGGFPRLTATEVARRAGVTWGAVQHHFGGKDGMLMAVLEDSFGDFTRRLDDLPLEDASLEQRVSLFVDAAWSHFASDRYRSTFEILLNTPREQAADGASDWRDHMSQAWDGVWNHLFADSPLPRRRRLLLQHYTISVLSGLASIQMLEGSAARIGPQELDLLKDTLHRELHTSGVSGRSG